MAGDTERGSTHGAWCDAGYHNSMPFLESGIVDTAEGHVRPLFQHILHPRYGATLSFVGLPVTVATFPQFEIQARLVSRMLSGRAAVPSREVMEEWAEAHYRCASVPEIASASHVSPPCTSCMWRVCLPLYRGSPCFVESSFKSLQHRRCILGRPPLQRDASSP